MPRGDRRIVVTIGLSLAAFAILAVASFAIYEGWTLQRGYQIQASEEANQHRDRASIEWRRECLPLAPGAEPRCAAQIENTNRENERKERDLEAQRVTALWTSYMGMAALIGAAFSIIGVGLIFITFRETKETNQISQRQLEITYAPQLRIAVGLSFSCLTLDDQAPGIDVNITNKGGPATRMLIICHVTAPDWGLSRVLFEPEQAECILLIDTKNFRFTHPSFTVLADLIADRAYDGRKVSVEIECHYNAVYEAAMPKGEVKTEFFDGLLVGTPGDGPGKQVYARLIRREFGAAEHENRGEEGA